MNLTRSTFAKVLAGVMFIMSVTVFVVGLIAIGLISHNGGFSSETNQTNFVNHMLQDQVYTDISDVSEYTALVMNGSSWTTDLVANYAQRFNEDDCNFFFTVTDFDTQELLLSNYTADYRFFLREDSYIAPASLDQYYSYYDYSTNTATSMTAYSAGMNAGELEPANYDMAAESGDMRHVDH